MLAQELAKLGIRNDYIRTESELTLEEHKGRWAVTAIELHVTTDLPEQNAKEFHQACKSAKARCPISHALNVPIKLNANLELVPHAVLA